MKKTLLSFIACFLFSAPTYANRAILVTGHWPPTNEMLREFNPNPKQNGGVWLGKNWENSGYDIYAYFPEFHRDQIGIGNFRLDFAATYNDFLRITSILKPVAILSFDQGAGPWEIENNFPAYFQEMFKSGQITSDIGEKARYSIPAGLTTDKTFHSTLPLIAIQEAVNAKYKGQPAWIDNTGDAGDYLSGFIGYLGAWYQKEHSRISDPNRVHAAGLIHVNGNTPQAKNKFLLTMRALVRHLKKTDRP